MCGRYVTGSDEVTWREWVEVLRPTLPLPFDPPPERAARPGSRVPTLARDQQGDGGSGLKDALWGLRFDRDKKLYFNVRAETLTKRFADSAAHRRCLFPARSFEIAEGESGQKNRAHHQVSGRGALLLAGIWEPSDEAPGRRASIVTRASRGPFATLHDRMPVIVPASLAAAWVGEEDAKELLRALLDGPDPELLLDGQAA